MRLVLTCFKEISCAAVCRIPILIIFSCSSGAAAAAEQFASEYCMVPVMDALGINVKGIGISDFFYTYPIAPHILVSPILGSLWTLKDFNKLDYYTPTMSINHLSMVSAYSLERNEVYIYDQYNIEHPTKFEAAVYKFEANQYPLSISKSDFLAVKKSDKTLSLRRLPRATSASLADGLHVEATHDGVYLVYPSDKTLPILGNQLARPDWVEFYPMEGRGDVLVNTFNGVFIITKNAGEKAQYCNLVKPAGEKKYQLKSVPVNSGLWKLDNAKIENQNGKIDFKIPNTNSFMSVNSYAHFVVRDERGNKHILDEPNIWSLGLDFKTNENFVSLFANNFFKIQDNAIQQKKLPEGDSWRGNRIRYVHPDKVNPANTVIIGNSGAYRVDVNGVVEKIDSLPIAEDERTDSFYSYNEALYFIRDNSVFKWTPKDKLHRIVAVDKNKYGIARKLIIIDKDLIVFGSYGAFKISSKGAIRTYISDLYRVGPIEKIEPMPELKAALVVGQYGRFIVAKDGSVSRVSLEGRESQFFNYRYASDGVDSYFYVGKEIYRIEKDGEFNDGKPKAVQAF